MRDYIKSWITLFTARLPSLRRLKLYWVECSRRLALGMRQGLDFWHMTDKIIQTPALQNALLKESAKGEPPTTKTMRATRQKAMPGHTPWPNQASSPKTHGLSMSCLLKKATTEETWMCGIFSEKTGGWPPTNVPRTLEWLGVCALWASRVCIQSGSLCCTID